jgi:hypothetical protein
MLHVRDSGDKVGGDNAYNVPSHHYHRHVGDRLDPHLKT